MFFVNEDEESMLKVGYLSFLQLQYMYIYIPYVLIMLLKQISIKIS